MRVGIIGCGAIGQRRANFLGEHTLVAVTDVDRTRAERLASRSPACSVEQDIQSLASRSDIDLVIVSTINSVLAEATEAAVRHGKHVLVEKPAGRQAAELRPILSMAQKNRVVVKVGFNHRFHPGLWKAKELCDEGALGPLMYVRARYGHGGRLGYDREWRADPTLSGGGELLDQGVHLIDLSRWFLGNFSRVEGTIGTWFWQMPVEDNGFLCLHTPAGQVAWLHASCTEWKNLFCFEIFGRDGKLQIDGLGGSYGTERLSYYHMLPKMGPPETTMWEYPGEDGSWRAEFDHFIECIRTGATPLGGLDDALAALDIVERVYADASARRAA